jgi:hypothetical protein
MPASRTSVAAWDDTPGSDLRQERERERERERELAPMFGSAEHDVGFRWVGRSDPAVS